MIVQLNADQVNGSYISCCSICGHRVITNTDAHFYTATKYAVTALTEGLRQELREAKTHIRATVRLHHSLHCVIKFKPEWFTTSDSMNIV